MQILHNSTLDVNALYGALIINPNGGEFWISGIGIDLGAHEIHVQICEATTGAPWGALNWSALKDWRIQTTAHRCTLPHA